MQDPGLGIDSQAELQSGQGGVGYRTGSHWGTEAHSGQQFFILLAQKWEQQHMFILKDFEE